MCRIASYIGPEIPLKNIVTSPAHSLIEQSQHATEGKFAVNGDGFGVSWYGESPQPGLYKDVLPAWADDNLVNLCRMVQSHLFIVHVRASTMGETIRSNCHPFVYKNWSFCHNGQAPHFPRIRRALEAKLPDDIYNARKGTTDSEMIFLSLLRFGLDQNPQEAYTQVLKAFKPDTGDKPVKITTVCSDGTSLYGFRYSSHGKAATLYLSKTLDNGGLSLASEPLCGNSDKWSEVPENTLCKVTGSTVEMIPVPVG